MKTDDPDARVEASNLKLQTSGKFQTSNTQPPPGARREQFEAWSLKFPCSLRLEVWSFPS